MPTPQDDFFQGPNLALQWAFTESPSSGLPPGYSFTDNPGNITIDVTDLALLMQPVLWSNYYIEVGITEDGVTAASRFAGLRIQSSTPGTYIEFAKYFDTVTSLPRLRATSYISNVATTINDIAYQPGSDIILRIENHDGYFTFLYMESTDVAFTQAPNMFPVSAAYSDSSGNTVGIEAGGNNAPDYALIVSHFFFRSLTDIVMNGDIVLSVTRKIAVNAKISLPVTVYPPVNDFIARQYASTRQVQLNWASPVLSGSKMTLSSPNNYAFDVTIADNGAPQTDASLLTPISNPIVQTDDGSFWSIGVSDNGALTATPAPAATFTKAILILMNSTPTGTLYELYVSKNRNGAVITTRLAPFTYLGVTIVRKANSAPTSVTDGTAILTNTSALSYLDGPLVGLSRYYYAAYAVYSAKATVPVIDATMPVFDNLYKNSTRTRLSRIFLSGPWSVFYAFARIIQNLVDVDIPLAMSQFNLQTATGAFANLWGQMFGSRRYPNEVDASYTARILNRVLLPRTISQTIIQQVLAVPGVFYCDISDASNPSMFIGHSFIGFPGVPGFETQGDQITLDPVENPFYFTVQIKMIASTNLALILQAINDNKEAGTRFSVLILETI